MRIRSPHILLTPAGPYEAEEGPVPSDYVQELTGRIRSATALVERMTPGLKARVKDGTVELHVTGLPVYRFEGLQGSVRLPPGKLEIELACSSNLWKSLSFESEWEPQGFEGTGSLSVAGFTPEGVYDLLARRQEQEKALRESEQRFRQLAENINEVFWLTFANQLAKLLLNDRAYSSCSV